MLFSEHSVNSKRSGMDQTVLPANYAIPVSLPHKRSLPVIVVEDI